MYVAILMHHTGTCGNVDMHVMQVLAQLASMLAAIQIMYLAVLMPHIGTRGNAAMHVMLILILFMIFYSCI